MQRPSWAAGLVALLLAGLAWAAPARAQGVTTASITGRVASETGEALAGVQIVATNGATGAEQRVVTRSDGRFNLRGLRPGGPYRVEASLLGYGAEATQGIRLDLGQTQEVNFTLRAQAVALEGLTVTAERDAGVRNGVSTTVDERTIENAPTLGRELVDIARFTPQAFVANEDDDGAAISIAGQNNRANALYIDGVVNNDVFGLSAQGTNGGQTGAPPISLDAIEQLQIAISPFDVTQSGFTGGALNAITRSGTNRFQGSAYYQLRNESLAGETPGPGIADSLRSGLPNFSNARYGFRFGGPLVRDRLFFFVNGELLRSQTPTTFKPGLYTGASLSRLDQIGQVLREETGYDPGSFADKASSLDDNKLFAKIDWNISDNHRLAVRNSYSHSDNTDAFASGTDAINYANDSEVFPNTTNSTALELNSSFGNRFANRLLLGYTTVRDDRNFAGSPFPKVQIQDGAGDIFLGSEQYSTGNILNQNIFSFTDNFNLYAGRHTLTFGTHNEFYDIGNLFLRQNFGSYIYSSVDDFLQSVCAAGSGQSAYCQQLKQKMGGTITPAEPRSFARGFSLVDNVTGDASNAIGAFRAYQLGFYAQDEFQATDRLRLTAGLRMDIPKITTDPRFAPDVFQTTIPQIQQEQQIALNGARPGQTPKALPYFSPRLGFNYDVRGDGSTQLRGGLGIFTGRVPFVYPGAMYLNNGATTGYVSGRSTLPDGSPVPFVPDPGNGLVASDFGQKVIPSGELDIFEDGYRYPRVFRTSLGVDHNLPFGFQGTLEGQYTKALDNIQVQNINLKPQNDHLDGPDNRPVYNYGVNTRFGSLDANATRIDPRYTSILKVGNTSEGYTYDVTASLVKQFGDRLSARLAYSYGDAFSVNDATSDQIFSVWRFNENVNGLNFLDRARSDFSLGSRILGLLTYRQEFLRNLATTISAVYTGETGRPFSYIIGNNFGFTGEGSGTTPLLYVPNSASELAFQDITDRSGAVVTTAAEQATAFDRFIDGNAYLRSRRGGYAERNATRAPFENVIDLKLAQEVFANIAGRRNGVELTLDIFNFTNLLNRDWGRRYDVGFRTVDLLRFERFRDPENGDLTPVYTFRRNEKNIDEYWDNRILDFGNYGSRWLMQLGVRYTF